MASDRSPSPVLPAHHRPSIAVAWPTHSHCLLRRITSQEHTHAYLKGVLGHHVASEHGKEQKRHVHVERLCRSPHYVLLTIPGFGPPIPGAASETDRRLPTSRFGTAQKSQDHQRARWGRGHPKEDVYNVFGNVLFPTGINPEDKLLFTDDWGRLG